MPTPILVPFVALLWAGPSDDAQLQTPLHEVLRFGDTVSAVGSWRDSRTGKRVGNLFDDPGEPSEPFTSTIVCRRDTKRCTIAQTYNVRGILRVSLNELAVSAWSEREITAVKKDDCIGLTLRLREPENSGHVRRDVYDKCRKNPVWSAADLTLVDGTSGDSPN